MKASAKHWLKNPKLWLNGFLVVVFTGIVYAASDNQEQIGWDEGRSVFILVS